MNEKQFIEKLQKKFNDEEYKIIYSGKNSSEDSILLCLNCNKKIIVNTGELFRDRRQHICSACYNLKKSTQKNREIVLEKIKDKNYNIDFFMQKRGANGNKADRVRFTCKKCDYINEMWVGNIIKNNSDCKCQRCSGYKKQKDDIIYSYELNELYPYKFTILNPYKNVNTDIKVRCNNCGFIRNVKPTALLRSGYCPKCDKKDSKGEQIIQNWLEEHSISFIAQKYFKEWDIGIHYFDFYLPELNLIIEYNGVQHYEYNPYFHHSKENFIYRKQKDEIKKEKCLSEGINYLSISYKNYHHLQEILSHVISSTTSQIGRRGKCLEIESFRKEEDIVWT